MLDITSVDMPAWVGSLTIPQLQHLSDIGFKPAKTGHIRIIVNQLMPFVQELIALKVRL